MSNYIPFGTHLLLELDLAEFLEKLDSRKIIVTMGTSLGGMKEVSKEEEIRREAHTISEGRLLKIGKEAKSKLELGIIIGFEPYAGKIVFDKEKNKVYRVIKEIDVLYTVIN